MKTVCLAYIQFADCKSYLGVFDDEAAAKQAILDAGCEYVDSKMDNCWRCRGNRAINIKRYTPEGGYESVRSEECRVCKGTGEKFYPGYYVLTDAFCKWISDNVSDTPYIYCGSADKVIVFDTIPINKIVRGFSDD